MLCRVASVDQVAELAQVKSVQSQYDKLAQQAHSHVVTARIFVPDLSFSLFIKALAPSAPVHHERMTGSPGHLGTGRSGAGWAPFLHT